MKLAEFAEHIHFWPRFRRAMLVFWLPLVLVAMISTIITLAANLPFAASFFGAILPLFGVAAYLAHRRYGATGLVSVAGVFLLGLFFKLLSSSAIGPIAPRIPSGSIARVEDPGPSIVILIAMIILFSAAAYFTGRLYGKTGMIAVFAGFVVVVVGLLALAGVSFG